MLQFKSAWEHRDGWVDDANICIQDVKSTDADDSFLDLPG